MNSQMEGEVEPGFSRQLEPPRSYLMTTFPSSDSPRRADAKPASIFLSTSRSASFRLSRSASRTISLALV
jgi:hypothetical protein